VADAPGSPERPNVLFILADDLGYSDLVLFLSDNGACAEWDPFGFDCQSGPNNVLHRGAALDNMGGPDTYHSYGSGWANAGGTPPADLDGHSFIDVLLGSAKEFRDVIFAAHTGDGEMNRFPQRGARDRRYKYVLNLHPERTWTTHFTLVPGLPDSHKDVWDSWVAKAKADPRAAKPVETIERHPAEELDDTLADSYELTNLITEPALKPVLDRLRGQLRQWRAAQSDTGD
jgi:arylsulfatase A-like enzyme